jgi:hypothetical protein
VVIAAYPNYRSAIYPSREFLRRMLTEEIRTEINAIWSACI